MWRHTEQKISVAAGFVGTQVLCIYSVYLQKILSREPQRTQGVSKTPKALTSVSDVLRGEPVKLHLILQCKNTCDKQTFSPERQQKSQVMIRCEHWSTSPVTSSPQVLDPAAPNREVFRTPGSQVREHHESSSAVDDLQRSLQLLEGFPSK